MLRKISYIIFVFGSSIIATIQSFGQHKSFNLTLPNSELTISMVPIPAGSFLFGSANKDIGKELDETPQRKITIPAFYMSNVEITRDVFDLFYTDLTVSQASEFDAVTRPSPQYIDFSLGMGKEGGFPANSMSQHAALMFCRWLYQKTGEFYRLPTEVEWEYAAKAGNEIAFLDGTKNESLIKYAWFAENSGEKFQKVGQLQPNAWGLFDMLGNLMEWTIDHYAVDRLSLMPKDSAAPAPIYDGKRYPKALRGGSYLSSVSDLRLANRFSSDASWNKRDPQIPKSKWWLTEASDVGFRIVKPIPQPSVESIEKFYSKFLGN